MMPVPVSDPLKLTYRPVDTISTGPSTFLKGRSAPALARSAALPVSPGASRGSVREPEKTRSVSRLTSSLRPENVTSRLIGPSKSRWRLRYTPFADMDPDASVPENSKGMLAFSISPSSFRAAEGPISVRSCSEIGRRDALMSALANKPPAVILPVNSATVAPEIFS